MTKREAAIVSAYTGILIGEFGDFHKYAEEIIGGPIWTHKFGDKKFTNKIKELSRNDFLNIKVED